MRLRSRLDQHQRTNRESQRQLMLSFSALILAVAFTAAACVALGYWIWIPRARRRVQVLERLLAEQQHEAESATEALARVAVQDRITGIPNHRRFQDFLRLEWRRALRDSSPISLIMIAVDQFRDYNDAFGQEAGDACLRQIAGRLSDALRRPGDLVARYGGEEFGVVLGRTDREGAARVAHRLHALIRDLAISNPRAPGGGALTVSLGVATATPALDSSWEELELIAAAGRGLVEAKDAGGDRIVVASD